MHCATYEPLLTFPQPCAILSPQLPISKKSNMDVLEESMRQKNARHVQTKTMIVHLTLQLEMEYELHEQENRSEE